MEFVLNLKWLFECVKEKSAQSLPTPLFGRINTKVGTHGGGLPIYFLV